MKRILLNGAVVSALAFGMLSLSAPALSAPGYHGAYFSESSFLSLAPGQTGQFAVGYGNTGDLAWVKGDAVAQASLRTRGNSLLSAAGWAVNWTAPTIYANQASDLVAPGQVGFFIYNVQVPANAPQGAQQFTGLEWAGGAPLEDYGYFQVVTVIASTLQITASSPASPSTTTTPSISGTGATALSTVTVQEGSAVLCTTTATLTGTFACLTTALTAGAHSLTATAPGQGTSNVFSYTVDTGAPTIQSVDTAQGLKRMNVCYSKVMATTGTGSITAIGSYTLSSITLGTQTGTGQPASSLVASADGRCVLFVLDTATFVANSTYSLTVSTVSDSAGNAIAAASTFSFTATDSTVPTASGFTQPGTQEVIVTFSEALTPATAIASNFKWDSASFPGILTLRGSTAGLNRQVRLAFNTGTGLTAVGVHSLDISGVTDAAGLAISPSPTSFSITVPSDATRPSVVSALARRADTNLASAGTGAAYLQNILVTFSEGMRTTAGWGATNAIDNSANYTLANPDGSSATTSCASGGTTAITVVSSPPVGALTDDTDERWELRGVRLTLSALLANGCQYTLSANNLLDQAGNALNPNPALITVSDSSDTAALTVASASTSATTLSVCYSKSMFASVTAAPGAFQSNTTASNTANYSFTASGGAVIALSSTRNAANNYNVSTDGRCVNFTTGTTLGGGTYTLVVLSVTDPAGNLLSPNPTTVTVSYADTTAPSFTGATYISGDSFSVTFSKAMTGGSSPTNSAGNIVNYSLNNGTFGTLCTVGIPSINSTTGGTVWTVTCVGTGGYTSNYNPSAPAPGGTGAYLVAVRNVADANGNIISPTTQTRSY